MSAYWFRADCDDGDQPMMAAFGAEVFPNLEPWVAAHAAHGVFQRLTGKAVRFCPDGDLSGLSPAVIAVWGAYQGDVASFAAAVRRHFLDDDGHLRFYQERQAKLLESQERDRERMRDYRRKQKAKREQTACGNGSGTVPERSSETDERTDIFSINNSAPEQSEAERVVLAAIPEHDRPQLLDFLNRVPSRSTWAAEMRAQLQGMRGHATSGAQLIAAVHDYVANGQDERPNIELFRRYVRRAASPAPEPRSSGTPRRRVKDESNAARGAAYADLLWGDEHRPFNPDEPLPF